MSSFWTPLVSPVQTGEPVDAPTTNRPILQLADREAFLYDQLRSLNQRSGRLVAGGASLGGGAVAGDVVYFNAAAARYEPALAGFSYLHGTGEVSPRARACGLVLSVDSSGLGDVLLRGFIDPADYGLSGQNLLDRAEADFAGGAFYLSRQMPGKISARPSAPVVALGFFDDAGFVFDPVAVGDFNLHRHQAFALTARPAASQNTDGAGFDAAAHGADYFFSGSDGAAPVIAMGFRALPGQVGVDPVRVDIIKDGDGQMAISLASGVDLDFADPLSATSGAVSLGARDWPQYGEYVAIPQVGVEIFFFRTDADYADTTLEDDADELLAASTDAFKLYLPDDAAGWTNANPFDPATPASARLRYSLENDALLAAEFPPQPLEAADLLQNGVSLAPGLDYLVTLEGLWWCAQTNGASELRGNVLGDPWPIDRTASGAGMSPANSKRLRLFFARSDYESEGALVASLRSASPALTITRCPGGEAASTGDLQIGLDLSLSASEALSEDAETAFTSVDGIELISASSVTELVEGAGIQIDRLSLKEGSLKRGRLRISRKDVRMEGEVASLQLRGASEIAYHQNVLPYLNFKRLDGRPGPTGAIASFKLPAESPFPLKLALQTSCLGDLTLGSASGEKTAVFKVVYHATRPGMSLSTFSDATALTVQYWSVPFASGYRAFDLLAAERPVAADAGSNPFELTPSLLNSSSPFKAGGGLRGNDCLAVYFQRVSASSDNTLVDNYAGQVGFLGLRWSVAGN